MQIQGAAQYVESFGSTTTVPVGSVNATTKIYIVDPKFRGNTTYSDAFLAATNIKGFLALINGQLAPSDDQSPTDAQGYPTAFQTNGRYVLTK